MRLCLSVALYLWFICCYLCCELPCCCCCYIWFARLRQILLPRLLPLYQLTSAGVIRILNELWSKSVTLSWLFACLSASLRGVLVALFVDLFTPHASACNICKFTFASEYLFAVQKLSKIVQKYTPRISNFNETWQFIGAFISHCICQNRTNDFSFIRNLINRRENSKVHPDECGHNFHQYTFIGLMCK